jgi:hypothetical protein
MRRRAVFFAIAFAMLSLGLQPLEATAAEPAASAAPTARPPGPTVTTSPTPTTRLFVKTVPQGAQVTLDGKPLGPSDGLFIVPPGVSSVKVEFAGQEPQERVVEIAAGRITRLELEFAPPAVASPPVAISPPFPIDRPKTREEAGLPAEPANVDPGRAVPQGTLAADGRLLLAASRVLRVPTLAEVPAIDEMPTASRIDEALLRRLPESLHVAGTSLRDTLSLIAEAVEIPISIDEAALSEKGLDPAAAVTVRVGGLPLGSAVSEIVRQQQLRWVCRGDGILVTASGHDQESIERVYRIDDFVTPNDPEGSRLLKFLSEASWPLETMPITSYRQLTVAPAVRVWTPDTKIDEVVVQAPWWRQWRTARLLALLRHLRSTPVADRAPVSVDGYWSDAESAAAVRAALDTPLGRDVAIEGRRLDEAIGLLSQAAGVPIVFDSVALADSPLLERRVAFSRSTTGQTLAFVLDAILGPGLCFELVRDQLTVSNRRWSSAAYYPVDDLLAAGHTFDSLRSRIGSEGGPTWVIDGGVHCLAITRTTAGHRAVEKTLRALRDDLKTDEPKEPITAERPESSDVDGRSGDGLSGGVNPSAPNQHEAVASFRVLQPDKDDYEAYRKTQAQLIKGHFVFQKALREPGIAQLPTLAAEKDPVGWLSKHVQASTPSDSEIIQVRLRGSRADDVRQILDAITTVYLKEIVQKERHERTERRRALEKTCEKAMEELRLAREALARSADDSHRERLQGGVTKLEQATKRMEAELDIATESIASIPDRVELVEAASSQEINP